MIATDSLTRIETKLTVPQRPHRSRGRKENRNDVIPSAARDLAGGRRATHATGSLAHARDDAYDAEEALEAGLVTFAPDDLDWDDELRMAVEERASLNPDALTGMEASLRFAGPETLETKIFGRLSAWQNWIFQRPNAVGAEGALKLFGTGKRANFDDNRV